MLSAPPPCRSGGKAFQGRDSKCKSPAAGTYLCLKEGGQCTRSESLAEVREEWGQVRQGFVGRARGSDSMPGAVGVMVRRALN